MIFTLVVDFGGAPRIEPEKFIAITDLPNEKAFQKVRKLLDKNKEKIARNTFVSHHTTYEGTHFDAGYTNYYLQQAVLLKNLEEATGYPWLPKKSEVDHEISINTAFSTDPTKDKSFYKPQYGEIRQTK